MNSTYYTKQAVGKTKVPEKISDKEGSNSLRSVHSTMTFICKTDNKHYSSDKQDEARIHQFFLKKTSPFTPDERFSFLSISSSNTASLVLKKLRKDSCFTPQTI